MKSAGSVPSPAGPQPRLALLVICATAIAVRLFLGPHVVDDAYITALVQIQ